MKKKLLIYGAGAIGRGYLPWVFSPEEFEYYYVEKNPVIRNRLKKQKFFTTYMSLGKKYAVKRVPVADCFDIGEENNFIPKADAVLTAVGPRNFMGLQGQLTKTSSSVICFENDSTLPGLMRKAIGKDNIVFAIPDVIASNTAPQDLLDKDSLSVVTENGECFVSDKAKRFGGRAHYLSDSELQKQWLAKLYIHNTAHCIIAYFGALLNKIYVHEGMKNKKVARIAAGVMTEMGRMLLKKHNLSSSFIKFYAKKELKRFSNVLLYDPISRVAREPFRKLAPNERLIGAAQACLSVGFVPENLIKGIMAAFCFESDSDPDFHIKHLMKALNPKDFLRIIIRLRPGEALYELLLEKWDYNLQLIKEIKNAR